MGVEISLGGFYRRVQSYLFLYCWKLALICQKLIFALDSGFLSQAVYVEAIKLMGNVIFDLSIENEALREKLGKSDEKWLNESKNGIKLSYDDTRKSQFVL